MDIATTIKHILNTEIFVDVPVGDMKETDSLRDVFGLDSLGFVELRVQCEDAFDVTISDDDFSPEHFATIAGVVELVRRLRASAAADPARVTP